MTTELSNRTQVSDCAEHPADIQVTSWSEVTCAGCQEQPYNSGAPTVACASDDQSYSSASSGEADDGGVVATQTPAPTAASTPAASGGGGGGVVAQTPVPTAGASVVDGECGVYKHVWMFPGGGEDFLTRALPMDAVFDHASKALSAGRDVAARGGAACGTPMTHY